MARSQIFRKFGFLLWSSAFFAAPTVALAGEQHLEFKLVTIGTDMKVVQAPNIDGRVLMAGKLFGVAYFSDGRVAVKDFIGEADLLKGLGAWRGYSTYTFQDGSSLTLSWTANRKKQDSTATILSSQERACMTRRQVRESLTASQQNSTTGRDSTTLRLTLKHHD